MSKQPVQSWQPTWLLYLLAVVWLGVAIWLALTDRLLGTAAALFFAVSLSAVIVQRRRRGSTGSRPAA